MNVVNLPAHQVISIVERLLAKLQTEVSDSQPIQHTIEALKYYHEKRSPDGIAGLEQKLRVAGRQDELFLAFDKKEQFAKLLEKWSLYLSAQELFAYLLARAEHEFNMFIYPKIDTLDKTEINELVNERVILPTISDCGSKVFTLNHSVVMGMVYWLAEQCFVRWHK